MAEERILDIMGHRVDLDKIQKPALRKVIQQRIRYREFMFAYGDHKGDLCALYLNHRDSHHSDFDATSGHHDCSYHYDIA